MSFGNNKEYLLEQQCFPLLKEYGQLGKHGCAQMPKTGICMSILG